LLLSQIETISCHQITTELINSYSLSLYQMASSTFDPNQFKTDQRQGWNSVAQGWKEWWQPIERGAQKLSRQLVELAEIKPGQRVLDIATGIGEPAMTAANVVGASGRVLATDISGQMLAVAKQRSTSLGLENIIEFRENDAENLDLLNLSFDAALCRWGLMLMPNLYTAISKIHNSLKSGGRFAAAVWADAPKVPIISLATSRRRLCSRMAFEARWWRL
jgi:ubiquinone/menaquinone biosynthesis C-methylase UbiE